MWKNLPRNITCTTPPFRNFLPDNWFVNNCKDKKEASDMTDMFAKFVGDIAGRPDSIECPLPCRQINYKISFDYAHEILYKEAEEKNKCFFFKYMYSTLLVDERMESYDYDIGSFLTAAGGNLGLFLGFSCLSILFMAIKWIKNYLLIS